MSNCSYPGCDWDGESRPYARKRDGIPSASTIAGMAEEKSTGMAWAASSIAASYAIHHYNWSIPNHSVCREEPGGFCGACLHVRAEFDRRWKAKAALGTHVHHLIGDMAADREIEANDEVAPYLDAWDKFVVEHWPGWVMLERTLRCNGLLPYRGTFDAIVDLTVNGVREPWLIDWKTGRFHPFSQTLQLAGYRYADDITNWVDGEEQFDRKMPPVKHTGVVLLGSDGEFNLVELPAGPEAHSAFMKLRALYDYRKKISKDLEKGLSDS